MLLFPFIKLSAEALTDYQGNTMFSYCRVIHKRQCVVVPCAKTI